MTSTQKPVQDAAPALDYRAGPDRAAVRLARVQRELAVGESLNGAAVALRLALGIPLALIGPFVITVFLVFIELRLRNDIFFGFGGTFCLLTLVLIPLLMWYERRSRGEFLTDAVRGETSPLQASSYGEYELQSAKFSAIGWTEVALTGPRLLWEAIDSLRRRAPAARPIRTLAAELVVDLYDAGE